jgi:hypothetical protein
MSEMNDVPRLNDGRGDGDVDSRLQALLSGLDPATREPRYWDRFHTAVLARASGELARRRALRDLSVSEQVSSWARAVVPTALLAAAAAGLMLLQPSAIGPVDGEVVLSVEEALSDGIDGEPIPALLSDDALPGEAVAMVSEIF